MAEQRGTKRKWVCPTCAGALCRNAGCGGLSASNAPSFYDSRRAAASPPPPPPSPPPPPPPPPPPQLFVLKCASLQGSAQLTSAALGVLYAPDKSRVWFGSARATATATANALTVLAEGARVAAHLKVPRLALYSNAPAVTALITAAPLPTKSRTRRLVAALRRRLSAVTHHVPPFRNALPFAAEEGECRTLLAAPAPLSSTIATRNVDRLRALRVLPSL